MERPASSPDLDMQLAFSDCRHPGLPPTRGSPAEPDASDKFAGPSARRQLGFDRALAGSRACTPARLLDLEPRLLLERPSRDRDKRMVDGFELPGDAYRPEMSRRNQKSPGGQRRLSSLWRHQPGRAALWRSTQINLHRVVS